MKCSIFVLLIIFCFSCSQKASIGTSDIRSKNFDIRTGFGQQTTEMTLGELEVISQKYQVDTVVVSVLKGMPHINYSIDSNIGKSRERNIVFYINLASSMMGIEFVRLNSGTADLEFTTMDGGLSDQLNSSNNMGALPHCKLITHSPLTQEKEKQQHSNKSVIYIHKGLANIETASTYPKLVHYSLVNCIGKKVLNYTGLYGSFNIKSILNNMEDEKTSVNYTKNDMGALFYYYQLSEEEA